MCPRHARHAWHAAIAVRAGLAALLDVIAVGLIGYAAALMHCRGPPARFRTNIACIHRGGRAWVVGSALVLILYWPQLAPVARFLVIACALAVELLALLQYRAAGAIRRDSPSSRRRFHDAIGAVRHGGEVASALASYNARMRIRPLCIATVVSVLRHASVHGRRRTRRMAAVPRSRRRRRRRRVDAAAEVVDDRQRGLGRRGARPRLVVADRLARSRLRDVRGQPGRVQGAVDRHLRQRLRRRAAEAGAVRGRRSSNASSTATSS